MVSDAKRNDTNTSVQVHKHVADQLNAKGNRFHLHTSDLDIIL